VRTRIWPGDLEVHIGSDIAYAILKYYQVSGDDEFLRVGGLRVLFEIAASGRIISSTILRRSAMSCATSSAPTSSTSTSTTTPIPITWPDGRFGARSISPSDGVSASPPTCLGHGGAKMAEADFALWREVAERIFIPIDVEADLIEQFEGYFELESTPSRNGTQRHAAVARGSRCREARETTLIKQPDVVMLFAMLGEDFSAETKARNYEFYEARTMHKSSLSPSIYAMVGMSIGKPSTPTTTS